MTDEFRAIIRLSHNESPFGPSLRALRAIEENLAHLDRYVGDELDQLTTAIATHERIAPEQIVLGEILDVLGMFLSAQGGPGGEFIYSEPGYTALVDAVVPAGCKAVAMPLNDGLENDLTAIASSVNERTRAVYLVNPHNPSGTVSPAAEFIKFVHDLSKRALVIVDEAYLDYTLDPERRTVAGLVRDGRQVVVFRTFAKIHGLAGLAIGYVLAPAELARSLRQIGIGAFHGLNRLGLVAAQASLGDRAHITAVRTAVAAERESWHALFRASSVSFSAAQGSFVFFDAGRRHGDVTAALAARGIAIKQPYPAMPTWLRISIGLPHDNALARKIVADSLR
ncbi:histidinol-phosphate transaminase [Tardiphaga sp. 709]|uniref:pyridoxal phosphate-dependent aminotransferase n=1 Tax=Tardiphaga sp. 709 TaxID=3076039 RepID=UPI0028E51236|nr:histidinol-phosphate transaminase [Tardiphaga sp. 709]WNV11558.1 histidinol-phosphate transaminase [Tardiphaga sp. 709]